MERHRCGSHRRPADRDDENVEAVGQQSAERIDERQRLVVESSGVILPVRYGASSVVRSEHA